MKHDVVEKNVGLMIILTIVALSFGTLVELVPLMFDKETNEPIAGLMPLPALALEGRDIYVREGCNTCHSQMIRPLRAETERYGHYSVAGEFVYDHPFLWGSKRTGPDLARVGNVTATTGTVHTCTTRETWYPSRTCRLSHGCSRMKSRPMSPASRWPVCAQLACPTLMTTSLALALQ